MQCVLSVDHSSRVTIQDKTEKFVLLSTKS